MQENRFTNQTNRRVLIHRLTISLPRLFAMAVVCMGLACSSDSPKTANTGQVTRDEVRIELTNNGFVPAEVTHVAGTFAIFVENTGAIDDYALKLNAADGTVLKEVQVQKGSTGWSVTLQPGRYTLTETNHPHWRCNINVQ